MQRRALHPRARALVSRVARSSGRSGAGRATRSCGRSARDGLFAPRRRMPRAAARRAPHRARRERRRTRDREDDIGSSRREIDRVDGRRELTCAGHSGREDAADDLRREVGRVACGADDRVGENARVDRSRLRERCCGRLGSACGWRIERDAGFACELLRERPVDRRDELNQRDDLRFAWPRLPAHSTLTTARRRSNRTREPDLRHSETLTASFDEMSHVHAPMTYARTSRSDSEPSVRLHDVSAVTHRPSRPGCDALQTR